MAKTLNRQPYSVAVNQNDVGYFNHTEFKGMCDKKNDINVDPLTFGDVKNVYIDEAGVLKSRPPIKFDDTDAYILNQWNFGPYILRFYRVIVNSDNEVVNNPADYDMEDLSFLFEIKCVSHTITSDGDISSWKMPISDWNYIPKVFCTQIEDKIFFWFAGIDFIALNTSRSIF